MRHYTSSVALAALATNLKTSSDALAAAVTANTPAAAPPPVAGIGTPGTRRTP